jgi:hypothetical protein
MRVPIRAVAASSKSFVSVYDSANSGRVGDDVRAVRGEDGVETPPSLPLAFLQTHNVLPDRAQATGL